MGGSHPDKDWSDFRWLELLAGLRRRCAGTIFLIGGPQNAARAKSLIEHTFGTAAINACDLRLIQTLALLRLADLFIGTDSGPMNLAVAAQTDAFALFGATPVLKYSKFIHPILPEGGPSPGGMKRISPATVMEQVAPLLKRLKNPK
jgi:ADP-heptose:LPS heptosyltransferase